MYNALTQYRVSYDPSHLMELLPDYTGGRTSFISLDASELIYYNTSADPWFSINTPLYGNDTNTTTPLYVADEPLNIMGCVTTTFVCNPYGLDKSKNCITTNSDMKFSDSLATLWPHTSERAVVQGALRFLPSNWVFNADTYFRIPGLPVMESQYWLTSGIQSDIIPSDRWQTEMRFAFEASLASLQAQMVQVASGYVYWNPANSGRNVEVVGEECEPLETCQTVCDRQLIRSPGYLSFSLFGVIMIIVIGFVLIVTGFCIEWIVFTIERVSRGGVKSFAEIEWRNCSALQLQRLGYEAAGLGAWSGADGAVPVTKPGDDLGVLDTTNVKHARLMRQDVVEGRSSQEATVHDAFLWGKTGPQRLKTEELS